ncbi:DGQHR domain-containing protein DpdB [Verrucomicrobia bacterium]|nr:DGQHR domain-containing protein DpdB [Verrucomicrobiota bacterium]
MHTVIELPAIKYRQSKGRTLYSFVADGKLIPEFSNIVRIGRNAENRRDLFGYQRPEVYSHIKEIKGYLEGPNSMMPNALVIAFTKKVQFTPTTGKSRNCTTPILGTLKLPCATSSSEKIGWIVDGQQRSAAIRDAQIKSFPIAIIGFEAPEEDQREQFILVNSTKPLPKDLIYELLPTTDTRLASTLEKKKLPSRIANELNFGGDLNSLKSPFLNRIKTPTNPTGNIAYNSVLNFIGHSINDGILLRYLHIGCDGTADVDKMVWIINTFWAGVASVFPNAWQAPPTKSRLTHGAGMTGVGFLMDAICENLDNERFFTIGRFADELHKIQPICAWTKGHWDFGANVRQWNEIQNIPKDIELLSNFLLKSYMRKK